MEVDLRSEKKEERTIRFLVDGKIQKCVIVGVGKGIRFGVCTIIISISICLFHTSLLGHALFE